MSAGNWADLAQLDVVWLSRVLREAGALEEGDVSAVSLETVESSWSKLGWIAVSYSDSACGELPARLVLKLCADPSESFGPSEFHYYARDYRNHPQAPLVRCYHAA